MGVFLCCSVFPQVALAGYVLKGGMAATQAAIAELPCDVFMQAGCAMGICAFLGLCFIQLLRWLPIRLLVYGVVLGSAGLLSGLGIYLVGHGELLGNVEAAHTALGTVYWSHVGTLLLFGVAVWMLMINCFWKEIRLSVAVLRSTTAFLRDTPCVPVLYPVIFGLAHLLGLCLWVFAVLGAFALLGEGEKGEEFLTAAVAALQNLPRRARLAPLLLLGKLLRYSTLILGYIRSSGRVVLRPALREAQGGGVEDGIFYGTFGALEAWRLVGSRRPPPRGAAVAPRLPLLGQEAQRALRGRLLRAQVGYPRPGARGEGPRGGREACLQRSVALSGCDFVEGASRAMRRAASAPKRLAAVEGASFLQRCACELLLVGLAGIVARTCVADEMQRLQAYTSVELAQNASFARSAVEALGTQDIESKASLLPIALACLGAWMVAESMMHPVTIATSTILHCLLLDRCAANTPHTPAPLQELLADKSNTDASFVSHYA
eukprot:CAMPEP_0117510900 /NCGR_PEP_ID=MMETSP0784-20121206/28229_1 /TAXON_ID=39447 /ORGANISM="" /LENGTH=490 /DNA_ID=CAMNT_0005306553 /DNA_START=38 /DNA_END=1509 /DNA_ORIENTATION=-